jgi:(2Fe-2S) ferredoxin
MAGKPRAHDAVATTPHLLVCTGPNCAARGAGALFSNVWTALEREGLAYYKTGGSVRCTASGCLGACAEGPTVAAYPAQGEPQWWVGMNLDATVALANELHRRATESPES